MIELKDESELGVAKNRALGGGELGDVAAIECHRPAVAFVESAQNVEQCAFAGTAAAFDGDEFTGRNRQIDAFEYLDIAVAHAESLADSAGDKDGRFGGCHLYFTFIPNAGLRPGSFWLPGLRGRARPGPRRESRLRRSRPRRGH